jgi:pimeloyl-ACP methyl ester carboxylesterase
MISYLSQFNYQIIKGGGTSLSREESLDPNLTRLVFLHGLMGFGLNWRRIVTHLPETCVSFIFDQRGHGKSIKPQSNYSPRDYAEDLELIRQELEWPSFVLVGHSMGGRNALWYTHLYPERVEKLIIEDIGPESKPEAISYYSSLINSIPTPFESKLKAKEWLLNDFNKTPFGKSGGQNLGHYLYANIIETPEGLADWRFSKSAILESVQLGRAQDHWSIWESLIIPTLIIRGENSLDLSQSVYNEMLTRQPLATGVVIPGSGHWVHFDKPQEFLEALISFLNFDKVKSKP